MALTKKGAIWIFWIGTLSSLILFLVLTVDTHRQVKVLTHAENLSEQVVQGKRVWQKYNCNDCHTILGFGAYYAPDMTKVYKRIGREGIRDVVKKPHVVFAASWRKMPQQNLRDKEIDDLVAFFKWVSEINTNDWPPQDSNKLPPSSIRRMVASMGVSRGAPYLRKKVVLPAIKLAPPAAFPDRPWKVLVKNMMHGSWLNISVIRTVSKGEVLLLPPFCLSRRKEFSLY